MGEQTGISWTDHTFNPWWGCTKVSPGCDHCYAETFDKRVGGEHWGKGQPRRVFADKHWNEPLKWNRDAEAEQRRHYVFCASMADVMDDEAPEGARERLWNLIDQTPWLIWQLLTKRPHRYERYLPATEFKWNNVWYGTTAENQEFYDVRFPIVKDIAIRRGGVDWISYEPAIGPLSIVQSPLSGFYYNLPPDWIIFGGESGNGRRGCDPEWAASLLKECREHGVSFFMKQMGGRTPADGKAAIPAHLMVQEFPA
jgi:protein gp37